MAFASYIERRGRLLKEVLGGSDGFLPGNGTGGQAGAGVSGLHGLAWLEIAGGLPIMGNADF